MPDKKVDNNALCPINVKIPRKCMSEENEGVLLAFATFFAFKTKNFSFAKVMIIRLLLQKTGLATLISWFLLFRTPWRVFL